MPSLAMRLAVACLVTLWHLIRCYFGRRYSATGISGRRTVTSILMREATLISYHVVLIGQICGTASSLTFPITETQKMIVGISGISLALVGFFLSAWTRYTRGATWGRAGAAPEENDTHVLITTGPYAFFRHPYYVSLGLLILGCQLALNSWLFLLVGPWALAVLCVCRKEEADLVAEYGEAYKTYRQRTLF